MDLAEEEIFFLICYVTSCDHVVKWPYKHFISHRPTIFGVRRHCAREHILILFCHMTSHDHLIRKLNNIMGRFRRHK